MNIRRKISRTALVTGMLAASGTWISPAIAGDGPLPAAVQQQEQKPNVLVWMLDDVGFAQLSCFGGLVQTPNIDRVARMGLRYSNYHTTPICSSSRAALLSGRNSHSVHMGGHAAGAKPFPGYDARIPASAGSIAANLRKAGYETFALGKWDHLPTEEASPAGPFNQWPAGQGFDRFYGYLAADADNWNPVLVRDTTPTARPDTPGYHLNADLADQAIAMIRSRDAQAPERPFFMYWATGTAHSPHHAPQTWIDRYKGKFDMGWDKARETILKTEKAQGLVPQSTELAPRSEGMPAWDSLSADQKQLYTRQMEVFAASMSYADEQFGRILDALQAKGELDNTMVVITSDNGASAEGAYNGLFSENFLVVNRRATVAENMPYLDRWGGPETYPHYSFGWAVAGNTPFRYYKQTAHEGGIHVPLVVAWPKGIAARGETRGQFVHVSDIAPTILEAAHVPLAPVVNDVPQSPMEGLSFAYSFTDPKAADRKTAQYFEMYGNKSLWAGGWTIATTHRFQTWELNFKAPPNEPWELYDVTRDPGQVHDLAARYPAKVAELSKLFDEQAAKFHLDPIGNLGDGTDLRKAAEDRFRQHGGVWRYAGPVSNIPGMIAPPLAFTSYTLRAQVDLPSNAVTAPLFAIGGGLGGLALYLRDGRLVMRVNTLEGGHQEVAATEQLPAGKSAVEMRFDNAATTPGMAADHRVTISAGGRVLARGTLTAAIPPAFGISETFDVGSDQGSTVLPGAKSGQPFPGRITNIEFDFRPPPK